MRKTMSKGSLGLLLGLSLVTVATPGFAENRSGAVTISPYVGGYSFEHKHYQNLETSPIFGLRAGYNFTEHWGAEARFGYVLAESRKPNYPEADVLSYGIDALYHFNLTPDLVPFVAAGIGGMHHNYPAPELGSYPEYAVNYGLGLKYFVADNVALRADVRHVMLPDDHLDNLEYTVGVTFQLGGVQPVVKTAAAVPATAAAAVECPVAAPDTTPPTVSLTAPRAGATGADVNKQVSVAFSEPMDPATINDRTFTLKNGETTIPGTVTATSATSWSFQENDSLQPGSQHTGRITRGAKDRAGNALASDYVWTFTTEPLSKTNTVTNTVTKTVVVSKFVMLGSSHFEFDQSTLTQGGKEALKQNAQIMKDNPKLKVRIAGYASAAGSANYNQGLSERRAEAAKGYLVETGGVDSGRISTIGYGETRPMQVEADPADLQSDAAKSNMRILFEVVDK